MQNIEVKTEYIKAVNYALVHNNIPICQSLELTNTSEGEIKDVVVEFGGEYFKRSVSPELPMLDAGKSIRLTKVSIVPDADKLLMLTERINTTFTINVRAAGETVFSGEYDITLMAFNQWLGTTILPQTLASFVTPNNPAINNIVLRAADVLKQTTGSSSFTEYQTRNTNDVRVQVAAVFAALHQLGIVYRAIAPSYEEVGQRVLLPEQVIQSKVGNCLELTVLFATVLEAIGINSGIVIQNGHAFLAVWLVNDYYSHSICDDGSFIEKKCAEGIGEMMVIECTAVAGEDASFESAVAAATRELADRSKFVMFIDVLRCRHERIFPLPIQLGGNGEIKMVNDGVDHDSVDVEVKEHNPYDLTTLNNDANREVTKLDIWERKLLDFSLRNSLLNLSLRRKAVQFISFDVDKIEDSLADGEEYLIQHKPEVDFQVDTSERLIRSKQLDTLRDLVTSDIKHHTLHTYHNEQDSKTILKNIYRAARSAIEETGANSLFMSIGTLRWFETDRSETPRYAPILLLPVDIVYKKGGYYVRQRDEEPMLNITLMEFLSQNFDMKINNLSPLPKDDHGVDVPLIFAVIRDAIKDKKRWDVEEESLLGTFSFSKFLMWNDIHNHRKELMENNVVSSLVAQHLTWNPDPVETDLRNVDCKVAPSDIALPVQVDSSQMSAVIESGKGRTFILYGPPGTGKSQTITNLIANALFQKKRVLFVAEKMAALSVVEERLKKIGLGPFCLEMHSNKVTKKHVLEQLESALNVAHIASSDAFRTESEKIFERRKNLIGYMEGLHTVDPADGFSLYDCIVRYETFDATPLEEFEPSAVLDKLILTRGISEVEVLLDKYATMLKLVGQPSENPLNGLRLRGDYRKEGCLESMRRAEKVVDDSVESYSELSRIAELRSQLLRNNDAALLGLDGNSLNNEWRAAKAQWFIPRFFAKKNFIKKMRQYNSYLVEAEVDSLLGNLMDYNRIHERVEQLHEVQRSLFGVEQDTDTMSSLTTLTDSAAEVKRWIAAGSGLNDWYHWCTYMDELEAAGMGCVAKALSARSYTPAEIRNSFFKAMYRAKAESRIAADDQLSKFEGMIFDDTVRTYRKLTNEFHLLTQKELYARLAAGIPRVSDSIDNSSEIGLLKRSISNNARGMALRDLFDQIPTLLPKLCPCMLMSPMSVAQYLDLAQEKFDLVIFDEASQMPTSEAVGAIARGKALIVVGDPKQMPPTSFFSSTNVDEDEVSIDDMESILEDCKALDIPSLQLNWHYRSRHESLIAFSNNEYYGGQLITFPSVDDQETKVKYIPVEGWYDKGGKRNNRAEAEAIVNEIVRRLEDPELCKRSIGVISFSVVQQYLIEDLLQDRLDSNAKLRDAAEAMYEPIFVKNLENVQGDERDIILFSIGYGPTKDGTVSMNFGPLNNVGGERRLNVAVSRARMEMYVFSTLKSSQIDLNRSKAKGVEGLKHFLEYAEFRSVVSTDNNVSTEKDVVIAEQLAAVIRERGYNANVAIGRSAFKVDIAISQKSAPETYFMGILLDGKGYMNTQTTRDREIVQPGVLANLNWKIMRVWSVDWYRNPQRVIDRVMETIAAAEKYKDVPVKKEEVKKFDISREKIEKLRSNAMPYVEYKYSMKDPSKSSALVCRSIVAAQQPITLAALCKVVSTLRSQRSVGSALQSEVSEFVRRELYVEQDRGFEVVWTNEEACRGYRWFRPNSDSYSRAIDEIPLAELKNAVVEAIAEQLSLAPDNLIVVASKKMGFTRRGAKVEAAFKLAIDRLKQDGAIVERDGRLYKE